MNRFLFDQSLKFFFRIVSQRNGSSNNLQTKLLCPHIIQNRPANLTDQLVLYKLLTVFLVTCCFFSLHSEQRIDFIDTCLRLVFFLYFLLFFNRSIFRRRSLVRYVFPKGKMGGYFPRRIIQSKGRVFGIYNQSGRRSLEGTVQKSDGPYVVSSRSNFRFESFKNHVSIFFLFYSLSGFHIHQLPHLYRSDLFSTIVLPETEIYSSLRSFSIHKLYLCPLIISELNNFILRLKSFFLLLLQTR